MGRTEAAEPSSAGKADSKHLSVRQAAFIGVGAMVGAGIVMYLALGIATLVHEPASIVTLLAILVLSVGLDYGWKRSSPHHPLEVPVGH